MVVYICPSQAPTVFLLCRLVYCQILLVHGFTVWELIRLLESIDSNFSYLPTTKEKKLSSRGERLSHVPYHSLCLQDFPLFFPHIYSASTDKSPTVTWPCLPEYSSSFIFITANSPKSRFYSGKNTFKFEEMSYSFILGPWHFFVFSVSKTLFHYSHLTSLCTLVVSLLSWGRGRALCWNIPHPV